MRRAAEFLLGGAVVYVAMAMHAAGCQPASDAAAIEAAGAGGEGGAAPEAGAAGAPLPPIRLAPLTYRGPSGDERPSGVWHDAERGEPCTFQMAADGRLRCLPDALDMASGLFADAACSAPVGVTSKVCVDEAPAYIAHRVEWQCYAGLHVFERGPEVPTVYARGREGECVESGLGLSGRAFAVGAVVEPEAFAEGSVGTKLSTESRRSDAAKRRKSSDCCTMQRSN